MRITQEENHLNPEQKVQQHLRFMIGGEEYAVGLLQVAKAAEYDTDTEILRTWEWIREMSASKHKPARKNSHGYAQKDERLRTRT